MVDGRKGTTVELTDRSHSRGWECNVNAPNETGVSGEASKLDVSKSKRRVLEKDLVDEGGGRAEYQKATTRYVLAFRNKSDPLYHAWTPVFISTTRE